MLYREERAAATVKGSQVLWGNRPPRVDGGRVLVAAGLVG